MKTIEQYEVEINTKSNRIQEQLMIFHENIGSIGNVIGKDSTYVFETLERSYIRILEDYNSTTARNTTILQSYVDRLDVIQGVLNAVMDAIDRIKESNDDESLDVQFEVNDVMEQISEIVSDAASGIETGVEKTTGIDITGGYAKVAIIGTGSYALSRVIGISKVTSLAIAAAAAYAMK